MDVAKQGKRAEGRSRGCCPLSSHDPETVDPIPVRGRQAISSGMLPGISKKQRQAFARSGRFALRHWCHLLSPAVWA
jgi:hypothetical protein